MSQDAPITIADELSAEPVAVRPAQRRGFGLAARLARPASRRAPGGAVKGFITEDIANPTDAEPKFHPPQQDPDGPGLKNIGGGRSPSSAVCSEFARRRHSTIITPRCIRVRAKLRACRPW
jgi:hypothetical protein